MSKAKPGKVKPEKKTSSQSRQTRLYRVLFIIFSLMVIFTFVLSLVR
jgi:hypothetical protein